VLGVITARRTMACARGSRAAGNGIWTGLSRGHEPFCWLAHARGYLVCCWGLFGRHPALPVLRGWPSLGIIAALVAVIWYGHRKSLYAFPWKRTEPDPTESRWANQRKSIMEKEIRIDIPSNTPCRSSFRVLAGPCCGFPPRSSATPSQAQPAYLLAHCFGWWAYCAIVGFEFPPSPATILVLPRLPRWHGFAIYCSGLGPSFNVWGRARVRADHCAGFDQVVVTPLVVLALAIAGGRGHTTFGRMVPRGKRLRGGITLVHAAGRSPTMRKWILTGQHRYRSPARLGANKQLLRQFESQLERQGPAHRRALGHFRSAFVTEPCRSHLPDGSPSARRPMAKEHRFGLPLVVWRVSSRGLWKKPMVDPFPKVAGFLLSLALPRALNRNRPQSAPVGGRIPMNPNKPQNGGLGLLGNGPQMPSPLAQRPNLKGHRLTRRILSALTGCHHP